MASATTFARLTYSPKAGQVLMTKEYDHESDQDQLQIRATDVQGISAVMSLSYETEEERDRVFDEMPENAMIEIGEGINAQIQELLGGAD